MNNEPSSLAVLYFYDYYLWISSFEELKPDNYRILETMHRPCAPRSESNGVRVLTFNILINLLVSTCCGRYFALFPSIGFASKSICVGSTNHRIYGTPLFPYMQTRWFVLSFSRSFYLPTYKGIPRMPHMWVVPPKIEWTENVVSNKNTLNPAEMAQNDYKVCALYDVCMSIKTNCHRKFGNNNFLNALWRT